MSHTPSFPESQHLPPFPGEGPEKPFPGFLLAFVLCVAFVFVTQIPGAVVAGVLLVFLLLGNPDRFGPGTSVGDVLQSPEGSFALGTAFLIAQILVIGFSLLMLRVTAGRDWPRKLALRWPGWRVTLLCLASTPAFVFLGGVVYAWLLEVLPSMKSAKLPGMEEVGNLFKSWPAVFGIVVIGFGPGIGEELWCRGFLGRGLVGRYGPWTGVLATSFFFGAIHLDPCQGTMAMLMGLWLHYVYLMTRSLWMPMLLHTVNNSIAVLATQLPELKQFDEAASRVMQFSFVNQAVPIGSAVLLFLVVALALYEARASLSAPADGPTFAPPFPSVECPPVGSATRILQGTPTATTVLLVVATFAVCVASLVRLAQLGQAG